MSRVVRFCLMWLVAIAVPIQGYAAAAMVSCTPGHHDRAAVQHSPATDGMQAHGHGVDPGAMEGMADMANMDYAALPDHHHPASTEAAHGHDPQAHGSAHKPACTPCSACGVIAGLPASPIVFHAAPGVDAYVAFAPSRDAQFLTEVPERPPRPLPV